MNIDSFGAMKKSHQRVDKSALSRAVKALAPLAIKLEPPEPGDWLADHTERGQTFEQYANSNPTVVSAKRNRIVILPLGDFNDAQQRILNCCAEFLSCFFGLAVRVDERVALASIQGKVQRTHPEWGDHQLLSKWVLDTLLPARLPSDAATYLCLTTVDLWPGRGWNFVFGQASLKNRVGVWSMYRYGDPSLGVEDFQRCLRRVLATAAHETAHMFSLRHCIANSCGMCGSNSLQESDRRPIHFCPQCIPKIAWATGVDLVERSRELGAVCVRMGLQDEAEYYERSMQLLETGCSKEKENKQ